LGTFHQGRGELHGITVVVDTDAGATWVGRCDTADERGVLLLDADVAETSAERDAFLARALDVGVWPKHRRILLAPQRVASIRPLGSLPGPRSSVR
jgi:hypothetical protein